MSVPLCELTISQSTQFLTSARLALVESGRKISESALDTSGARWNNHESIAEVFFISKVVVISDYPLRVDPQW
jgi:hypothetical protein